MVIGTTLSLYYIIWVLLILGAVVSTTVSFSEKHKIYSKFFRLQHMNKGSSQKKVK